MNKKISAGTLIFLTALFLVVADNYRFFVNVLAGYPLSLKNIGFLISLAVVFCCFLIIFFNLLSSKFTTKPVLIFSVLTASLISYFANTYNVIIDDTMLQNTFETNISETADLLNIKLFLYVFILGIIPAYLIYKTRLKDTRIKQAITGKILHSVIALIIIVAALFSFSSFYASFLREHKPLRFYTNPTYAYYSAGKFLLEKLNNPTVELKQIGLDAQRNSDNSGRKLSIVVVGEAVRADRFGLNGYARNTTPLLSKEDIINFPEMYSCGTTTAISVPCMFSILDRNDYSDKKAKSTENVLDVLNHAGVHVLWRDNNSSSKGVADRVRYEDYRSATLNKRCAGECRDEGMLDGLQNFINQQKTGDILIVLHQMGNHGPAYYKRYPQQFEKFGPVCATNQLEECRPEEVGNAYDNAILYTDHFLQQAIELLKQNDKSFQTALIYMSDHGESLGEGGLYLHGMPYFIAPEAQKHVASFLWLGAQSKSQIDMQKLKQVAGQPWSQDNLFHTLLGLMQIKTHVYDPKEDLLATVRHSSGVYTALTQ